LDQLGKLVAVVGRHVDNNRGRIGVRTTVTALAFFAAMLAPVSNVSSPASAQTYPSKPIRFIVPVVPGGATDVLARLTAEGIGRQSGQPGVVENRGGAGGNLAVEMVARSASDGYTLLFATNGTITINPALVKNASAQISELIPVAAVAQFPNLLVINAALPARNLREFMALAKSQPGKINYASPGPGTTPHLAGALFAHLAGIDLVHVPYRGAAPATTDLVSGRVQMISIGYATVEPFVQAGTLRILAVAARQRLSYLPDVPTAAEAGLPGWEIETWYGLFAPPATAKAVVDQLNFSVQSFLDDAGTKQRFASGFYDPMKMTPDQFSARVHADAAKWQRVVHDTGIAPQ
jgi:tripartite-type tricarboxylate transporter receptor subunit TctC